MYIQDMFARLNRDRGIVVAGVRVDPATRVAKKVLKKEVAVACLQSCGIEWQCGPESV